MAKKIFHDYVHAENKRILVAFGDIIGFKGWARRNSTSIVNYRRFVISVFKEFLNLRKKGYFVKTMADGVMIVFELQKGQSIRCVQKLMCDCIQLRERIMAAIKEIPYPRPEGFRTRLVACDAWKMSKKKPRSLDTEYIGYGINLAFLMLKIDKFRPYVCHQGVYEMFTRKQILKLGLNFNKIHPINRNIDGIDNEDLDALWEYECKGIPKQ